MTFNGFAPTDEEGFIVSFDVSKVQYINDFYSKFGFVCIKNVLNEKEIELTCDEFFSQFDKNDDESIEEFYSEQLFAKLGIVGNVPDIKSIQILENRQNQRVYEAFATVLGKDLIVDHDRIGAMRPTFRNGVEKPNWRTVDRWLHLDCNPVTGKISVGTFASITDRYYDFTQGDLVQGFISLTDAYDKDGGFHCVPSSHKIAKEWALKNKHENSDATLVVAQDDPLRNRIQRISVRKGCLFFWSSHLFHANRPNHSENWRIVQYIRMYPKSQTAFQPLFPDRKFYPIGLDITPLGEKLFGLT